MAEQNTLRLPRVNFSDCRLRRSLVLYPAVSMVSVGAEGHHGHPSRDARPLASGRLSSLLVLEVAPVWRATADQRGAARLDPANEHREPALGSTAYPRRIAQARVGGRAVERCQVHGQAGWTARS